MKTVFMLIITIGALNLSFCAGTTSYEVVRPDPRVYGLREFHIREKSFLVLSEDDDTKVLVRIISSLGNVAMLGEYLNLEEDTKNAYKILDETYAENPEYLKSVLGQTNYQVVMEQLGKNIRLAGHKLIQTETRSQLKDRYQSRLGDKRQLYQTRYNSYLVAVQDANKMLKIPNTEKVQSYPYNGYHPLIEQDGERFLQGETVYTKDECIGPVIMGRCHGSVLPKGSYHEKCYGDWVGGQCTGPQF